MVRRLPLACCLAFAVAACGEATSDVTAVTVDTLPSGAIVVTNWPPDDLPVWRLDEDLRIGRMDGEGPDLFGDVRALTVGDDGRVYVLEAQAQEVRIFEATGAHVATVGGTGEGPGEFTAANGIALGADGRLRVPDPRLGRVTLLHLDGTLEGTVPVTFRSWGFVWQGAVLDDGRLVDTQVLVDDDGSYRQVYRMLDADGHEVTVLAPARPEDPRWEGFVFDRGSMQLPFGPRVQTAFLGDGTTWSMWGQRYELIHRTLEGDTLRIVRSATDSVPVAPEAREEAIRSARSFAERVGARPSDVDASRIPTYHRVLQGLAVDDEGRLWVRLASPPGGPGMVFDVFDAEGRLLARAEGDATFGSWRQPVIREDALHVVVTDELGVPYVVRLRVRR